MIHCARSEYRIYKLLFVCFEEDSKREKFYKKSKKKCQNYVKIKIIIKKGQWSQFKYKTTVCNI